ncbi:MAG: crossover junction endodeoxyribonuclease RuvC [Salibacteraceae bacterium]
MSKEKVILGIDPGTNIMGYGVLCVNGSKLTSPSLGIVQIKTADYGLKLKIIFERTSQLIEEYKPDEFAVEAPFYGKNVQSMLKLGRAQGVAMAAALMKEIPIAEYSPRKIKQSITGNGAASKEQVASMIKTLVSLETLPKHLDATDGLAAAICHHFQTSNTIPTGGKGGWESFIKKNPGRIR